jgi:hypothetical protein
VRKVNLALLKDTQKIAIFEIEFYGWWFLGYGGLSQFFFTHTHTFNSGTALKYFALFIYIKKII